MLTARSEYVHPPGSISSLVSKIDLLRRTSVMGLSVRSGMSSEATCDDYLRYVRTPLMMRNHMVRSGLLKTESQASNFHSFCHDQVHRIFFLSSKKPSSCSERISSKADVSPLRDILCH